jgi:hypothetical protein
LWLLDWSQLTTPPFLILRTTVFSPGSSSSFASATRQIPPGRKNRKPGNCVFSVISTDTSQPRVPVHPISLSRPPSCYPVATAGASIRPTMLPNNRRVRFADSVMICGVEPATGASGRFEGRGHEVAVVRAILLRTETPESRPGPYPALSAVSPQGVDALDSQRRSP